MKYFFMLFVCLTLSHFGYTQNDDRGYIVKVGDKAPDITITYTDGTRKKLSDFRGKIVMLQFTASWCGVCRKEMPFIEKDIWLKHKNNPHFALIGIDLKENREQTIQFGKDLKITYPLTLDPEGKAFYSFASVGSCHYNFRSELFKFFLIKDLIRSIKSHYDCRFLSFCQQLSA